MQTPSATPLWLLRGGQGRTSSSSTRRGGRAPFADFQQRSDASSFLLFAFMSIVAVLMVSMTATAAIVSVPTASQLTMRVPFKLQVDTGVPTSIFLSSQAACGTQDIATTRTLVSPSFEELYKFPDQTVSTVYVCDSTSSAQLLVLSFRVITFTPSYMQRFVAQTITFSTEVPVGSSVRADLSPTCTGTTKFTKTVDGAYSITHTESGETYNAYLCATVPNLAEGGTTVVNVGQFVVYDTMLFSPMTTLRNYITTFALSGAAAINTRAGIYQTGSSCRTALVGPVVASGAFGKDIVLNASVSGGSYQFCIEHSGVFVPASGPLTVLQVTASPLTFFQNLNVAVLITSDIAFPINFGFSTTPCTTPNWAVAPTAVTSALLQTFTAIGTYYSCYEHPNVTSKYVLANVHRVVAATTVTSSRGSTLVRGLGVEFTFAQAVDVSYSLRMGVSTCVPTPFLSANASIYKSVVDIPLAGSSSGTATLCVWTPDRSATYAIATYTIRDPVITHAVLIAGTPATVTLDADMAVSVAGVTPAVRVAVGSMTCTSDAGFGDMSVTPLAKTLTFTNPGTYTICARTTTSFVAIQTMLVFAQPTATPTAAFAAIATNVVVSGIPEGYAAGIGATCASLDVSATRAVGGPTTVTLAVNYPLQTYRVVCAFLPAANATIMPYTIQNMSFTAVASLPSKAFRNQLTHFSLQLLTPSLLTGAVTFFSFSGSAGCTSTIPPATAPVLFGTGGSAYSLVTVPDVSQNVTLCVGGNAAMSSQYVAAGSIFVIASLLVTYTPSRPVVNVPFHMSFSGNFVPSRFAIALAADGCGVPIVSGPLVEGATTSSVLITTANTYAICVEVDPNVFLVAATANIALLYAKQATYVRFVSTALVSEPPVAGLFLTAATDCTGTQYTASVATPLEAPQGTYTMCALVGGVMAKSSNRVTVIAPYTLQLPTSTIRSYVPFTAAIGGGDIATEVAVYFIPALHPTSGAALTCLDTPLSNTSVVVSAVNSTMLSAVPLMIPAKESLRYHLCVLSADGTLSTTLATITPAAYMTPASIAKTLPVTITSGNMATGFAIIAEREDCSGARYAGPVQVTARLTESVLVSSSILANKSYYCESVDNGVVAPYAYRGTITLIDITATNPPAPTGSTAVLPPVGFENRTIPPATPVQLMVPPSIGRDPFVSRNRACTDVVARFNVSGYLPAEGEVSSFYVCATSNDGTLNISMAAPNLHVSKYSNTPRLMLSPGSSAIALTPATSTSDVYFSSAAGCPASAGSPGNAGYLGAASAFASGLQTLATTHVGIVFICARDARTNLHVPIASVLAVAVPVLTFPVSTLVRGIPWCMFRSVPEGLYSLVPGADATSVYRPYYTSTDRSVFLVPSGATCVLANAITTPVTQASATAPLCIPATSAANGTYTVCAGTPLGLTVQMSADIIAFAPQPSSFVTGSVTPTTFPGLPRRTFLFVESGKACTVANAVTNTFMSNNASVAAVPTVLVGTASTPLTPALYTLCVKEDEASPSSAWLVAGDGPFRVHAWEYFGLDYTLFTTGTPTPVKLLHNLRASSLRTTLASPTGATVSRAMAAQAASSAVAPCDTELPTAIGSIAAVSGDDRSATILVARAGSYVVCATTAVNNSLVPVATIVVVESLLVIPTAATPCDIIALSYSDGAEAAAYTQNTDITLYNGQCCGSNTTTNIAAATVATVPKPAATAPNQALRTVAVHDDVVILQAPVRSFAVCVRNSTYCIDAGHVTFSTTSLCVTPLPTANSSNFVGGAAVGGLFGSDKLPVTLIVLFFCLLLLCVCITCIACVCYRRRRVVPKDSEDIESHDPTRGGGDGGEGEEGSWRHAYGRVLSERRLGRLLGDDVAFDMRLNNCLEAPVEVQECEHVESRQRAAIIEQEDDEWELFMQRFAREAAELEADAADITLQQHQLRSGNKLANPFHRAGSSHDPHHLNGGGDETLLGLSGRGFNNSMNGGHGHSPMPRALSGSGGGDAYGGDASWRERMAYFDSLFNELIDEEESHRMQLAEEEDAVRLDLAVLEREAWRVHMERQRSNLFSAIESDPYWRSRRRQLREANDRAFASISDAHQLSTMMSARSASTLSSTTGSALRSHPSERMYQGSGSPRSGSQWPSMRSMADPVAPPPQYTMVDDRLGTSTFGSASRLQHSEASASAHHVVPMPIPMPTPPTPPMMPMERSAAGDDVYYGRTDSGRISPRRPRRDTQQPEAAVDITASPDDLQRYASPDEQHQHRTAPAAHPSSHYLGVPGGQNPTANLSQHTLHLSPSPVGGFAASRSDSSVRRSGRADPHAVW